MNKLQRIMYDQLMNGDPKLRRLFENFVTNMGHERSEAKTIVESILSEDKQVLSENMSLAEASKFRRRDEN